MAQHTMRSWRGHMSKLEQVKMGGSAQWWQQYEPVRTDDDTSRLGTKRSEWHGRPEQGSQHRLARASEAGRYPIAAMTGVVDLDAAGSGTCSETRRGR